MRLMVVTLLLLMTACATRVDVPVASQPPQIGIKISNTVETQYDQVDQPTVANNASVFGTLGAVVRLSAYASNPYGISNLTIDVTQGGTVLFHLTHPQAIAYDRTVENPWAILGINGGGAGGANEIRITLSQDVLKNDPNSIMVKVKADDFYGNSREIEESFFTDNGCGQNLTSVPQGGCLCLAPNTICGPATCCSVGQTCCNGQCVTNLSAAACGVKCKPGDVLNPDGTCCPPDAPKACGGRCFVPGLAPC